MLRKYRKKPVIIEAYQTNKKMTIKTLEGVMITSIGDYIITGVNGEQYPCKPDIFEKTYDQIDENEYDDFPCHKCNIVPCQCKAKENEKK